MNPQRTPAGTRSNIQSTPATISAQAASSNAPSLMRGSTMNPQRTPAGTRSNIQSTTFPVQTTQSNSSILNTPQRFESLPDLIGRISRSLKDGTHFHPKNKDRSINSAQSPRRVQPPSRISISKIKPTSKESLPQLEPDVESPLKNQPPRKRLKRITADDDGDDGNTANVNSSVVRLSHLEIPNPSTIFKTSKFADEIALASMGTRIFPRIQIPQDYTPAGREAYLFIHRVVASGNRSEGFETGIREWHFYLSRTENPEKVEDYYARNVICGESSEYKGNITISNMECLTSCAAYMIKLIVWFFKSDQVGGEFFGTLDKSKPRESFYPKTAYRNIEYTTIVDTRWKPFNLFIKLLFSNRILFREYDKHNARYICNLQSITL